MRKPSEEQVREEAVELLEPFGVSPSGIEHCGSHISVKLGDTFRLIYSDRFETVSYAGDVTPWKIDELPVSSGWMEAYKKIQSLLSEPTLQEQVEGYVEFNISNKVMVRLTERGRKHLEGDARVMPKESDGWSEWQLWDIANTFGTLLFNGCDVPFETCIRIPLSEITPPSLEAQTAEQQRVIDGLREELKREHESVKGLMIDFGVMRDKKIALQRENESLLDKFGPIDEAECKAAASVTELAGLVAKQADIQDEIFQMIPELVRNIAIEVVQVQGRANRCSCGPAC